MSLLSIILTSIRNQCNYGTTRQRLQLEVCTTKLDYWVSRQRQVQSQFSVNRKLDNWVSETTSGFILTSRYREAGLIPTNASYHGNILWTSNLLQGFLAFRVDLNRSKKRSLKFPPKSSKSMTYAACIQNLAKLMFFFFWQSLCVYNHRHLSKLSF